MSIQINRTKYANMFGPTVGDKVRLADTELFIEIEKDFAVYGEEPNLVEENHSRWYGAVG